MYSVANMNPLGVQIPQSLTSRVGSEGNALSRGLMPMPNVAYNDPILKVFEQIEEGTTAKYLEHSWKQSSVTWLGKFFDKYIWKAGEFSTPAPAPSEPNPANISDAAPAKISSMPAEFRKYDLRWQYIFMAIFNMEYHLYDEDLKNTWGDDQNTLNRMWSFIKCSLKISHLISGHECSVLPKIRERRNFCPPISEDELICLPLAISEDKGEMPYCLPKNPRTMYLHVILKEEISQKVRDLYNACFARYQRFCANNCLTCNSLSELDRSDEFKPSIGKTLTIIYNKTYPGLNKDFSKFNVTAEAAQGELTEWEKFQLKHFVGSFLEDCEWKIDWQLKQEPSYKKSGYIIMGIMGFVAVSVAGVSIVALKKLKDCLTRQREVALKQDDVEQELSKVTAN